MNTKPSKQTILMADFCKKNKLHPMSLIAFGVAEMGWAIAVPKKVKTITGMVIGQDTYIDDVLAGKYATKPAFKAKRKK